MSILNVNQIQPVGSGQTVTISAANITASSSTISASSFVGSLTGDATGLTGTPNLNVGIVTATSFSGSGSGLTGLTGVGKILQVQTAIKTDVFSYTATSFTDVTGLSVNITPSNASNKIILMASVFVSARGNFSTAFLAFGKGGSVITASTGDAAGSRPRVTTAQYGGDYGDNSVIYYTVPMMYSETAGATTQQTYSVMIRQSGGITMYVNRSIEDRDTANYEPRGMSSLIAMEVSA